MTKPVVNIDEVEFQARSAVVPDAAADRFEATFARIGLLVGAKRLGYNIAAVPPGKSAFPYHSHRVNEEMFFVLRGAGEVRIGAQKYPLRAGDIVACPAGGPESAHRSSTPGMRSCATSRSAHSKHPRSGVPGLWEVWRDRRVSVTGEARLAPFFHFFRLVDGVDYWDGE